MTLPPQTNKALPTVSHILTYKLEKSPKVGLTDILNSNYWELALKFHLSLGFFVSSKQKTMGVFQVSYLSIDTAPWTLQVGALEKSEDFPLVSHIYQIVLDLLQGMEGEQQDPGIY